MTSSASQRATPSGYGRGSASTSDGTDLVRRAELVRAVVEAEFLAPLSEPEARRLVAALRKLATVPE